MRALKGGGMLFGISVFQSVLERLKAEEDEDADGRGSGRASRLAA